MREIGADDFEGVLTGDRPVLVDLWAPWCGPCKAMLPQLEKFAAAHDGKVEVVKVNVDEHPDLAQQLGVTGVPTLVVYAGGTAVARNVGALPASKIAALVRPHLD